MTIETFPSFRRAIAAVVLGLVVAIAAADRARAYTPESPEVKQCVSRAIQFLESDAASDDRLGARALVGMALLKNHADPKHPRIVSAADRIKRKLGDRDPAKFDADIYSTGLAAIFLITLDPSLYAPEVECLMESLRLRQKPHGGWGYPGRTTGDTSMTQYGVLSSWEAKQAGFRTPQESIEGVAAWLLRTQDPSGAFGYQGTVSNSFVPVKQSDVRHSMAAAGLGSLYICCDMLGLVVKAEEAEDDDGLPPALKEVKERKPPQPGEQPKTRLDPRLFREAQSRGNRWFVNNYSINPKQWTYYYMYALERYMSFRELAEGKVGKRAVREPQWYNDGVRFLIQTQLDNGSWEGQAQATADTAFAALFLLRSTKKSIEKAKNFGDGTLVGGRGLPKETARAELRMGKVVAKPLLGPAEQLLAVLENSDNPDYSQAVDLLAELPSQEAAEIAGKHAEKLRRLAADRSPEARMAAVRALAKTRNFDNVPTLIYALTDPDRQVMCEARDALRRLSRRPGGFGLPDRPTESGRLSAIKAWKQWYLAVRPDAEFQQ